MANLNVLHRHVPKLLYSIPEVMASVSVGRTHLYAEISRGNLKTVKSGKLTRIRHEDLVAWIDAMQAI